jgi:hypothetical protein
LKAIDAKLAEPGKNNSIREFGLKSVASSARFSTRHVGRLVDNVAVLPIYCVIIYTFWLPGYEKLFDRERTIPYYTDVFDTSILGRLGLTNMLITAMGVLELCIVAAAAVSLFRREFLPARPAPILKVALFLSASTFAMLGFGLRLIQNHAGTANQFYYFACAVFFLVLVQHRENPNADAAA